MDDSNEVLTAWNRLDDESAAGEVLLCCGSHAWARALAKGRPFASAAALMLASDAVWSQLPAQDWEEAFATHPRIGDRTKAANATAQSAQWSGEEQRDVAGALSGTAERLAHGNALYEQRFGRVFLVCASGRSAEELLTNLESRLLRDDAQELREAVEQQRQITQLRLKKWLQA